MTVPPLPADPCMRVRLNHQSVDGAESGCRFYLRYAGAAPTGGNCTTLAGDIATIWNTRIAPLVGNDYALAEVDVLDIASYSGLSGQWTGSYSGSNGSDPLPGNIATNVEFGIARRYRGGKPRIYLPGPSAGAMVSQNAWQSSFVSEVSTDVALFFSDIAALSVGAVGAIDHVNLSYYSGFTNHTSTSGRERAVPTYRDTALVDAITGYFCKTEISQQRRRRTATTY